MTFLSIMKLVYGIYFGFYYFIKKLLGNVWPSATKTNWQNEKSTWTYLNIKGLKVYRFTDHNTSCIEITTPSNGHGWRGLRQHIELIWRQETFTKVKFVSLLCNLLCSHNSFIPYISMGLLRSLKGCMIFLEEDSNQNWPVESILSAFHDYIYISTYSTHQKRKLIGVWYDQS
jgi:hypothetical protein